MVGLGEGGTGLTRLGQGVGVDDPEEGFGLGVDLSLGPVQAGLSQSEAVLGPVELEPVHGHRAHDESVVPAQA